MSPHAERLLTWYDREHRPLPWRLSPSPYRTWLSEVMLQQTRVEVVEGYFHRFMERFPTVQDLAAASLDEVLQQWAGLGYYSRGRNLHSAARILARDGFPTDAEGWRAMPGVGAYTAGAIASIALGQDEPAIDGNAERVLSRWFRHEGDRKALWPVARSVLPPGRAGDFNQALMDLGARICKPRRPLCGECPVSTTCLALLEGEPERFPRRPERQAPREVVWTGALCMRDGAVLFARRPARGLFGGLWELPGGEVGPHETPASALGRHLAQRLGGSFEVGDRRASVEHRLTHRQIALHVHAVQAASDPVLESFYDALSWGLPEGGVSTLTRKALAASQAQPTEVTASPSRRSTRPKA